MITGIFQSVVMATISGIFLVADYFFMRKYGALREESKISEVETKSEDETGTGRTTYMIFAVAAGLILFLHPIIFPVITLNINSVWGFYLQLFGILLSAIALMFNWWSRTHLGKFYSEGAVILEDHQLIDTGPYKWIRHPFFTSLFILVFGLLLITPSLITIFLLGYTLIDFGGAAVRDEKILIEAIPEYEAYMQRTGRFFPRL